MTYLTSQIIIDINKIVMKRANEKYLGLEFPQELSNVINQPKMNVFGKELYPTLWIKASFIVQKITKKHIFKDGNKRTAFISLKLFLLENNYHLELSKNQLIHFILSVTIASDDKAKMKKVAKYLKKHSVKK